MPPPSLPPRPNLQQLKNQAKDLLKAYRAGQPAAFVRFRESLPRLSAASDEHLARLALSLRDAQRVVAVEHGFANWSHMQTHIQRRERVDMLEMTIDHIPDQSRQTSAGGNPQIGTGEQVPAHLDRPG